MILLDYYIMFALGGLTSIIFIVKSVSHTSVIGTFKEVLTLLIAAMLFTIVLSSSNYTTMFALGVLVSIVFLFMSIPTVGGSVESFKDLVITTIKVLITTICAALVVRLIN